MPTFLPISGAPEEVREHTKLMCSEVGAGGGFVMMPTIGDLQDCNPDLIDVWVEATREYGAYRSIFHDVPNWFKTVQNGRPEIDQFGFRLCRTPIKN
jgi:hypothetical protein